MAFNPNTIWLSHSSLNDFEKCHKLYYLRNLYRDKLKGNRFRIQIANPYFSLGEAVHDAIDRFVTRYPTSERDKDKLFYEFKRSWQLRAGRRGGFKDSAQEEYFKQRGEAMLERFYKNSSFSKGQTLKVDFPKLPLVGEDEVVLVGNFDWLEKTSSGLHILDFKTGTSEEEGSLQLPIYALLATHVLKLPVEKVSYWYLDRDDKPKEVPLGDLDSVLAQLKQKAQEVATVIAKQDFTDKARPCTTDCEAYQAVVDGKGEYLFTDFNRKREVFYPNV
ncbi:MAG TPA: PD-(D/E)XK nuclease family protein [Candidatus Nanoarchaeia archaeon]|nr:hypothetical protein [uncultured archaeon]